MKLTQLNSYYKLLLIVVALSLFGCLLGYLLSIIILDLHTPQSPEFSVDAKIFKEEYRDHGLRANKKYAGKTIVLRGEVTDFGKYPNLLFESEKVYIILDDEVIVYLDADYTRTLLSMDKGDNISVVCKVPDAFAINIEDCKFWGDTTKVLHDEPPMKGD